MTTEGPRFTRILGTWKKFAYWLLSYTQLSQIPPLTHKVANNGVSGNRFSGNCLIVGPLYSKISWKFSYYLVFTASIPNGLYSGTSFDGTSTVYVLVEILPPHAQICVLSKEMGGNQNIWHSFKVLNNIDVHWTLQKKE